MPLLIGLSGCFISTRDNVKTEGPWTVARKSVDSQMIFAECSRGKGSDVLEFRLDGAEPGMAYVLPSPAATGRAWWYFDLGREHADDHPLRGSVRVLSASTSRLELDVDVEALHPLTDRVCRSVRRRIIVEPSDSR